MTPIYFFFPAHLKYLFATVTNHKIYLTKHWFFFVLEEMKGGERLKTHAQKCTCVSKTKPVSNNQQQVTQLKDQGFALFVYNTCSCEAAGRHIHTHTQKNHKLRT
eukprot:m.180722 g.180722  ORF g.180722 m.180722 type:complete len:105 (-) comp16619_c0_seq8:2889-3203(-)